jgi:hypothetical protein
LQKKSRGGAKGWNCKEWADATKNKKRLPEHVKKAELEIQSCFSKIAEVFIKGQKLVS